MLISLCNHTLLILYSLMFSCLNFSVALHLFSTQPPFPWMAFSIGVNEVPSDSPNYFINSRMYYIFFILSYIGIFKLDESTRKDKQRL